MHHCHTITPTTNRLMPSCGYSTACVPQSRDTDLSIRHLPYVRSLLMTHTGARPVRIALHRRKDSVICAGVLDLKQAQEWVVTTKLGASDKRPGTQVCPL